MKKKKNEVETIIMNKKALIIGSIVIGLVMSFLGATLLAFLFVDGMGIIDASLRLEVSIYLVPIFIIYIGTTMVATYITGKIDTD